MLFLEAVPQAGAHPWSCSPVMWQSQECVHPCQLFNFLRKPLPGSQAGQQHLSISKDGTKGLEKPLRTGNCRPGGAGASDAGPSATPSQIVLLALPKPQSRKPVQGDSGS